MIRAITASFLLLPTLLLLSARCAGDPRPSPAAEEMLRDEVGFLIREATAWVEAQRDEHRPDGRRLTAEEKRRLAGFFPPEILEETRVKAVRRIDNPGFFAVYQEAGRPLPLDFSGAVGLALIDTILVARSVEVRGSPPLPLLFHELVHLVQYRRFGVDAYFERYVRSWADNDGRYRGIAFEQQAFRLQRRFRADPAATFSVWDEVERRFGLEPADPSR